VILDAVLTPVPWAKLSRSRRPKLVIRLDDDGELVGWCSDNAIGFLAEMEAANDLVGRQLWTKKAKYLSPDCEPASERKRTRHIEPVVVTRVDWSYAREWQPDGLRDATIELWLRSAAGTEGCLETLSVPGLTFLDRFYRHTTVGPDDLFYSADPRKSHPTWKPVVWDLLMQGEVAIGMTEEMVAVACGGSLEKARKDGMVLGESGIATIYGCGGRRFLLENGRVTKYVE